jgi:hypothetical protein
MATDTLRLRPQTITGLQVLSRGVILLVLVALSGVLIYLNYWFGVVFLFLTLLIFIVVGFKKYQGRNLLLLLYIHLLAVVLLINVIYPFLLYAPVARQLADSNGFAGALWGGQWEALLSAILFSICGSILTIAVPFFLVLAVAALIVWNWPQSEGISYFNIFLHLVRTVLGLTPFLVVVEDGELKGDETDKTRMKIFGGPGWLVVDSGYIVVLQRRGIITRAVGRQEENIKSILPLAKCGDVNDIETLTRDRIPLTIKMLHVAQLESATETKDRYQQAIADAETHLRTLREDENASKDDLKTAEQVLEKAKQKLLKLDDDPIIGDDFDEVYESIAVVAAKRSPDIRGALKGAVANNLKDTIMSTDSEELFTISDGISANLEDKINKRKIAEIEQLVREKVKGAKLNDGIRFRFLDIQEVHFPEELQKKINEEVEALIEERIQRTKARIEGSKAKGAIVAARAKAQARALEGQGEGEAQARLFREILRELKREAVLRDEEIANALLKLISSTTSIKELESFFKAASFSSYHQPVTSSPDEVNGSH